MTNVDTPQQLERNSKPASHEHVGDEFCIDCITDDLLRKDHRFEVTLIAAVDLRRHASPLIEIEKRIDERITEIENEENGTEHLGHWRIN